MKKKILVVDDEPAFTRMVRLALEKTGCYLVKEVNDPKEAIAAAEAFNPDLALLDVLMPEIDGGELARRFKKHPQLKKIPIVFLTAIVKKDEARKANLRPRTDRFIAKPVNLKELIEAIVENLPKNQPTTSPEPPPLPSSSSRL